MHKVYEIQSISSSLKYNLSTVYSCWTISSLITVSWKAQVSSAVGTICSAGSRNLNKRVVRVLWNTLYSVHVPVEPGVPELHAGGEPDAHLAMRPVRGAPAGDVQQARDTTHLYSTVQCSTLHVQHARNTAHLIGGS